MNYDQNNTASTLADLEANDTAWLEVQNKKDDGPLLFNGACPPRTRG